MKTPINYVYGADRASDGGDRSCWTKGIVHDDGRFEIVEVVWLKKRDFNKLVWPANIMLVCMVAMAAVIVACLLTRACEAEPAEPVPAVAATVAVATVATTRPLMAEMFPEPVCEFCGQVLDGSESGVCPGHE